VIKFKKRINKDTVMCWFEVLQVGAKGPYLHKLGNWLVRQLNDEPKPYRK
jgi:hypothetical protein